MDQSSARNPSGFISSPSNIWERPNLRQIRWSQTTSLQHLRAISPPSFFHDGKQDGKPRSLGGFMSQLNFKKGGWIPFVSSKRPEIQFGKDDFFVGGRHFCPLWFQGIGRFSDISDTWQTLDWTSNKSIYRVIVPNIEFIKWSTQGGPLQLKNWIIFELSF